MDQHLFRTVCRRLLKLVLFFIICAGFHKTFAQVTNVSELVNAVNNGSENDTIIISPGIYELTSPLRPKPGMLIAGRNKELTIIKGAASWDPGIADLPDSDVDHTSVNRNAYLIDLGTRVPGVTLRDLTLRGPLLHGAVYGNNCDQLTIHDVNFVDFLWSAIRVFRMGNGKIYNCTFIDAGGNYGKTGGAMYLVFTDEAEIYNNRFEKTPGFTRNFYGVKGRLMRNSRIHHNTIMTNFAIELPFENDKFVEIDHNYLDGVVSIPKFAGGIRLDSGSTFHIHHNYFTRSYSIEFHRNDVEIDHNLFDFDVASDRGNLVADFGRKLAPGATAFHDNLIKNPGRGIFWSNGGYENFSFFNNHVIGNTTVTPRKEGMFTLNNRFSNADYTTLEIKDNIFEFIGQSRPLFREDSAYKSSVINNVLINVRDSSLVDNVQTGDPQGPLEPLFFRCGAGGEYQVDQWDIEKIELSIEQNGITFPAGAGVVDVTKAPYFAAGDGITDDTDAINQAMRDHPDGQFIIYLPNGTYLVSDRIDWPRVSGTDTNCSTEQSCRYTILQGQSTGGTVIKLADNAPGYQDPADSKSVLWCGRGVAQRFRNAVRDLTVNVGSGNPGAIGIQFNANNTGGIFDAKVLSEDGQGVYGLDFGYTNEIGPLLVKNVEIDGFQRAITTDFNVNSMTFEDITIRNQSEVGIFVKQQVVNIRGLASFNEVTAVQTLNQGSYLTLIDSELNGTGNAANVAAVFYGAEVFLRNVSTPGYRNAVTFNLNGTTPVSVIDNLFVDEYTTGVVKLCENVEQSLDLPVSDAPVIPWDDPGTWANIDDFGAIKGDNMDDTGAIQAAMNSGASTVLIPVSSFRNGSYTMLGNVTVPATVKRIIGTEGRVGGGGLFELVEGADPIIVERFDNLGGFVHTSSRTLVMKNARIRSYTCTSGADLYLEDVGFPPVTFKNQNVWARQYNTENEGVSIINDNSNLWIFGFKTERRGTKIRTINGGKTEVLGAHIYSTSGPTDEFMFEVENASLSLASVRETNFGRDPYTHLIKEVRGEVTRELMAGPGVTPGGINASGFPLFVGYVPSADSNSAPQVSVPGDVTLVIPQDSIFLAGEVNDDGLPGSNCFSTIQWAQIEGPASSIISSPSSASTSVVFPVAGKYVFVLSANDGMLEASDTVNVFLYDRSVTTADHDGDSIPSGNGADAQVLAAGAGNNNYGAAAGFGIRHDPSRFHRKGYLRFDVSAIPREVPLAGLALEIATTNTGQIQDWTYNVFGLEEAADYGADILDEFWQEGNKNGEPASAGELTYNNAPGNGPAGGGVYNAMTNTGGGVNNDQTRFLGTFDTRAGRREIINFNSDALAAFLNDDTNGVVTLIITRVERNTSNLISFSSKENTAFIAPTLHYLLHPDTVSHTPIGEVGKLTAFDQADKDTWTLVGLTATYAEPVIVAGPLSFNGEQPSTVRVRNVDSVSFEIQIDEWDYLDGKHVAEDLSYMVVEAGVYTLPNGSLLQAGIQEGVSGNFVDVTFPEIFDEVPIVFSQCISTAGSSAVVTRVRNVSNESFQLQLQVEEANSFIAPGIVAWVAITPGISTGTRPFEVSMANEPITHVFGDIGFDQSYEQPVFLASMQEIAGSDPAALRYRSLTPNKVSVKVEEEKSRDTEINHNPENIGFLVYEGPGKVHGQKHKSTTLDTRIAGLQHGVKSQNDMRFSLYPNPVNDLLNLEYSLDYDQKVSVSIHDLQGKMIMHILSQQEVSQGLNKVNVDVSGLNEGVYIVRLEFSNEPSKTVRIIKTGTVPSN